MTIHTLWKAAKKVFAHIMVASVMGFVLWVIINVVLLQKLMGFLAFIIIMIWAIVEVMDTW